MTCFFCGAQVPYESSVCPQCKGVQPEKNANDQVTISSPEQLTQTFAYNAPPSSSSLSPSPSPFNKKKLRTILLVGGVAAVVIISLMVLFTVLQPYSIRPSLRSGAQMMLNPYTRQNEMLMLSDPLHDNSVGDQHGYHWMDDVHDGDPGSAATKGCYFADQKYHISTNGQQFSNAEVYCLNTGVRFSNFTFQVQMSVQQGHLGGIIFRQSPGAHFYAFMISDTGDYFLFSSSSSDTKMLARGVSDSINQQPGMSNLLAVVANGSKLDMYINQHYVASITDSTYSTGLIGTIAIGNNGSQSTDIAYADAKVWIPSK